MLGLRILWSRVRSLFRRREMDDRLNEEIEAHLEMAAAAHIRRGLSPSEARYASLRSFGGVEQTKEIHRDTRGFAWLDALRQDATYARRTLAKSPGFALTAVNVLGLAIGANTALFTFFNGYVLKPLAIPDGQRNYVDDHYFSTMEIPVTQGRNFIRQELTADSRVAIVSEATARRWWPGGDPIGRVFQVGAGIPKSRFVAGTYQVIGVVGDVASASLSLGKDPSSIYFPVVPGDARNSGLIVRARGAAPQLVASLREICAEADSSSSCQPTTLRDTAWLQIFPYQVASNVASWMGLLALILTCVGLYGVVAFAVVQRTREFGIRMALGASRADVLGLVLRRSIWQVGGGIAIGIPLCLALSKYTVSVIWMLETFDFTAYALTPLLLIGVTMVASYLPARRATVVEPMVVLREE